MEEDIWEIEVLEVSGGWVLLQKKCGWLKDEVIESVRLSVLALAESKGIKTMFLSARCLV